MIYSFTFPSDTRIDCLPNDKNDNNKSHFNQNTTEKHQIRIRNITKFLSNVINEGGKRKEKRNEIELSTVKKVKYAKMWKSHNLLLHTFFFLLLPISELSTLLISFIFFFILCQQSFLHVFSSCCLFAYFRPSRYQWKLCSDCFCNLLTHSNWKAVEIAAARVELR